MLLKVDVVEVDVVEGWGVGQGGVPVAFGVCGVRGVGGVGGGRVATAWSVQEPGDGAGHAEVGVVEVVAVVPFEGGVGTAHADCCHYVGGACVDLPHEGMPGAALFVPEGEIRFLDVRSREIVPDVFFESGVPH